MLRYSIAFVVTGVACCLLLGCTVEPEPIDDPPEPGDDGFVSSDPNNWLGDRTPNGGDGDGDADGDSDGDADGDSDGDADADGDGDAERSIEEADIIKVDGDTLYALSEFSGLVIIDISDPERLSILGRHPTLGLPFEMYVRDGIAYPIYSSFWSYEYDEETETSEWVSSSRIMALDVTDPANIRVRGAYDLAGEISDSRIVGDVLYAVAFENGWCWRCESTAQTTITSLNIADSSNIVLTDRLSFESEGSYGGRRSISVNDERMYVAGRSWSDDLTTIQVVDISDPSGRLNAGAEVDIAGQIDSRWQMNEYDGVLRVVSQPWSWGDSPVVETFTVASSDDVTPLGRLEMVLPRPEDLMSVRFDGPRGYAVTFQQTDPLFVIDLSDPAHPEQRGELEIPGWLYHMEPRGDRLYAIGYDEMGSSSLAVSLFDVSDMDTPVMLDRVNFGGSWSWMVEDQDRIHKAFRLLSEIGLIVMPFAGWSHDDNGDWYSQTFHSGIQLIDYTEDDLELRGVLPHHGQARRAFVHRDHIFAMSDERVEAFDFSDRDHPISTSEVLTSRSVYRAAPVGDHVVELVSDWWTGTARLDVLPIDSPDGLTAVGSLDLSELRPEGVSSYYYWYHAFSYFESRLFSIDDTVVLFWAEDECGYEEYCESEGATGVAVVDVSDPTNPTLEGVEELGFEFPFQAGWWYSGEIAAGDTIAQVGSTFVFRNINFDWYSEERAAPTLEIVDISDPTRPTHASSVMLPGEYEMSTLQVVDGNVVTSHREPVDESGAHVRFFMDTLDVSEPADPRLVSSINIPGSPVWFDSTTARLVTVDYEIVSSPAAGWDDCDYSYSNSTYYYEEGGACLSLVRSLNLLDVDRGTATLLDRITFHDREVRDVRVTPSRVFVGLYPEVGWHWETDGADERPELITLTGVDTGTFHERTSVRMRSPYTWLYQARDEQAIILSDTPPALDILDATDADDPIWSHRTLLSGYGYDVHIQDDAVISSNGQWGVQVIDL